MITPRLANKEAREFHELLLSLGWQLLSGDDHLVYEHPTIGRTFTLAQTPSSPRWRTNSLTILRRLHNDTTIGRSRMRTSGVNRARRQRQIEHAADQRRIGRQRAADARRREREIENQLRTYARSLDIPLSQRQARHLIEQAGGSLAAREFLSRVHAARRRQLARKDAA